MSDKSVKVINRAAPFGGIYCLTIIGAAVYFCQHASGFWGVVGALLKSLVWPAFVTHRVFQVLGM
jgi:hypothetical protein